MRAVFPFIFQFSAGCVLIVIRRGGRAVYFGHPALRPSGRRAERGVRRRSRRPSPGGGGGGGGGRSGGSAAAARSRPPNGRAMDGAPWLSSAAGCEAKKAPSKTVEDNLEGWPSGLRRASCPPPYGPPRGARRSAAPPAPPGRHPGLRKFPGPA